MENNDNNNNNNNVEPIVAKKPQNKGYSLRDSYVGSSVDVQIEQVWFC
jgi:hypothetical protein